MQQFQDGTYIWNPWHGCKQCEAACEHCYLFVNDYYYGKDPTKIYKSAGQFGLPIRKTKSKRKDYATNRCDVQYTIQPASTIEVCNSSDFFLEEADEWREQAWDIIRERSDCLFRIITKRPENIKNRLPSDWGEGWNNVLLCTTITDNNTAWERVTSLLDNTAKHFGLWMEPLYEYIDIGPFLSSYRIEHVAVGGERYAGLWYEQHPLDIKDVRKIREACKLYEVTFRFIKTGTIFINDEGNKLTVHSWDERGLADFFKLNIPEIHGVNWEKLPNELYQQYIDKEAHDIYSKIIEMQNGKIALA